MKQLSRLNAFWRHKLRDVGPMYPHRETYVEAHRGGLALEPENTLRAFGNAIDLGADSVELDVIGRSQAVGRCG